LLGIGGRTARSARAEFSDRLGVTLDDTEVRGPAAAGSEEPVADVEVALVALVGEVGRRRSRRASRSRRGAGALQPHDQGAGGAAAAADWAAVDHVDVHRPPDGVVRHPGGALDIAGVAAAQTRQADGVAVGDDGQQGLDPQIQPRRGQIRLGAQPRLVVVVMRGLAPGPGRWGRWRGPWGPPWRCSGWPRVMTSCTYQQALL
jgi:hypothetical protein